MKLPKTTEQFALSLLWSFAVIIWISYILVHYGGDKGILNLLIGFMTGGAAGGIFGVYFMAQQTKKVDPPTGTTVKDTTIKEVTTVPAETITSPQT